jgi:hypothetical protein
LLCSTNSLLVPDEEDCTPAPAPTVGEEVVEALLMAAMRSLMLLGLLRLLPPSLSDSLSLQLAEPAREPQLL